eukprot:scaffold274705_cov36-Tisochrysis_lutea.AAC.3
MGSSTSASAKSWRMVRMPATRSRSASCSSRAQEMATTSSSSAAHAAIWLLPISWACALVGMPPRRLRRCSEG